MIIQKSAFFKALFYCTIHFFLLLYKQSNDNQKGFDMKLLIKATLLSIAALSMTACSSTPSQVVSYEKVGKVQKVMLMLNEKKPSFVEVFAGATLGGLVGNQFGGGSGKYWTTAIGALAGAKVVDEALSKKYKSIHYVIYYPSDRTKETLVSTDLSPTVFRGDLVLIKRHGDDYQIDAYGKYSKANMERLQYMHDNGLLK